MYISVFFNNLHTLDGLQARAVLIVRAARAARAAGLRAGTSRFTKAPSPQ